MSSTRPDALVIGSGVIGLTTAIALAEAGLAVRIRTAALPQQTTSRAAAAMWGSGSSQPAAAVRRRAERTLDELRALAGDPRSGVRIASGTVAARSTAQEPPPFLFPGVEATRSDSVPPGFLAAYSISVPVVDMPRHLDYLLARFEAAGGDVEVRAVRSLGDVAGAAPAVVNCTGIGARDLVPDAGVRPVRGQHVIVENPGIDEFFVQEPAQRWTSWWPHGDEVVLGGIAQEGETSLEPDMEVADAILRGCTALEPRFAGARVIEHRVGLRPVRDEVRLEEEPLGASRCVHNYGHGRSGVALAWGCAREVAELLGR